MAMKEQYYTIDGQMLGYKTAAGRKDFLTDALGSITAEVDQTGATKTFDGRYKPYGGDLSSTGTRGSYGWVGTWGYRGTGLSASSHYVRARHYSKTSGTWITLDPLWPSEQPYTYLVSNPVQAVDPSGMATSVSGCLMSMSSWGSWQKQIEDFLKNVCGKAGTSAFEACLKKCSPIAIAPGCIKKFCSSGSITCGPCDPDKEIDTPCPPGCGCTKKSIKQIPCASTPPDKCGKGTDRIRLCTNSTAAHSLARCGCTSSPKNAKSCHDRPGTGTESLLRVLAHEIGHVCNPECASHPKFSQKQLDEFSKCLLKCSGYQVK